LRNWWQCKYAGNQQANITEDDLVTQAVQAFPAVYSSTVANLIETEQQAGNDVTITVLHVDWQHRSNYS
jgi:hypothetical protein